MLHHIPRQTRDRVPAGSGISAMREQPTRAPSGYWPEIATVLAAKAVALTVLCRCLG
jgi:hypothetical protein